MASNKTRSSGVTRQASTTAQQVTATRLHNVNTMNPATASQVPTDQNTPVSQGGVTAISSMTDDELAALVKASDNAIMPNFLADIKDRTQRFVYQAGLNALPTVLDDAAFNQFLSDNNIPRSDIMARDIDPIHFTAQDGTYFSYKSTDIANMLKYSKFNYIGGKKGGQRYGAGTYFAQNGGGSTGYGSDPSFVTVEGVLNPATARVIDSATLSRKAASFAQSHPKFAAAVGGYVSGSQTWTDNNMSIWALAMGYNVINDGTHGYGAYYTVIDRSAFVYRK